MRVQSFNQILEFNFSLNCGNRCLFLSFIFGYTVCVIWFGDKLQYVKSKGVKSKGLRRPFVYVKPYMAIIQKRLAIPQHSVLAIKKDGKSPTVHN